MDHVLLKGGYVVDFAGHRAVRKDVLIEAGLIAWTGLMTGRPPSGTEVIPIKDMIVIPGLIDAHIHVESTLLAPLEFARAAILRGTTAVLADPHEIANVFGLKGVRFFLEQAARAPLDMLIGIPSCVPATTLEHGGASISAADVASLLAHPLVFGLAEMMDYPGILSGCGPAREKVDIAFRSGKLIDGHCPGLRGEDLRRYISNGAGDGIVRIMTDHETSDPAEAEEKIDLGMRLALRYGSAEKDLDAILPGIASSRTRLERCMLCSDDLSPVELLQSGHVDRIVRRARVLLKQATGWDGERAAIEAIRLATRNTAEYLAPFARARGLAPFGDIREGFMANCAVVRSLDGLEVDTVLCRGRAVVRGGEYIGPELACDFSGLTDSVNTGRDFFPSDFRIVPAGNAGTVRVIGCAADSIVTEDLLIEPSTRTAEEGVEITADPARDIAKIAVIERHHATGSFSVALVRGLGVTCGAIASTIAHDSHNLIVAGCDGKAMALAVNHLRRHGGGMVVVEGTRVRHFPLPIAGLMSDRSIGETARGYRDICARARERDHAIGNVFMHMAFLALPVIPRLRITDMGLVDVVRQEMAGESAGFFRPPRAE
jgi:adenine deaminase